VLNEKDANGFIHLKL